MTEKLFDVDSLWELSSRLSCDDQFRLATLIAENVGYVLRPETDSDLADCLAQFTNLIMNERVKSYNEGLDAGRDERSARTTERQ